MKVKEKSEKAGLNLNIQKTKIMASDPITSWQVDGKTIEAVTKVIIMGKTSYIVCYTWEKHHSDLQFQHFMVYNPAHTHRFWTFR